MTQENLLTYSNYDEAVDGDVSDNPSNPTQLTLSPGTTNVSLSTGDKEEEYLTVVVPDGFELDSLVLESFSTERNVAFIGVQEGDEFTEPLNRDSADIGNLLGYDLFGEPRQIGTDILDDIGDGFGAIGFEGALSAGEYTFALRQAGIESDYTLAFNVSEADEPEEDNYVYEGWDDYSFEFVWNFESEADSTTSSDGEQDIITGRDTEQWQMNSPELERDLTGSIDGTIDDLGNWVVGFEASELTQPNYDVPFASDSDWSFARDFDFTNLSADNFV